MDLTLGPFLLGVLAGLATSAILWILKAIYTDSIRPRLESLSNRVPAIEGDWQSISTADDKTVRGTLEIKQIGTKITAKLKLRQETGAHRKFNLKGEFHSGKLILTFEEPHGAGFIVGAVVLMLGTDLNILKGKSTYIRNAEVVSTEQLFKRI